MNNKSDLINLNKMYKLVVVLLILSCILAASLLFALGEIRNYNKLLIIKSQTEVKNAAQ